MCGIVGGWSGQGFRALQDALPRMSSALAHRGPDDGGHWFDADAGIAFGHRRLSIVDLSPAGHQPMISACGRFVIVFNGEIYNHLELRRQLELGATARANSTVPTWRGHSDTETLLACFAEWGVEHTLRATTGMFALALWDRAERNLVLARDRLGEKPLYYGRVAGALAFASELKAVRAFPGFDAEIDRGAVALLMRHNYVPAPHCIYRGLHKLMPGTWIRFSPSDLASGDLPSPQAYWSATEAATAGVQQPLAFASEKEAADALESTLMQAVAGQMIADVPLGAFLSGGVDSSTVVALMQVQCARPVRTFSIGFREDGYDEAQHANLVARHLGTEHTEMYVTAREAMNVIPRLADLYDEPFSDSSQIPTHLVAQLARRHVTVSLSGDGGDELFGGYTRYFFGARLWQRVSRIPPLGRRAMAAMIRGLSPNSWDRLYRILQPLIPPRRRWPYAGDKLHKGAAVLAAQDGMGLYRGLTSHWNPAELMADAEPATVFSAPPQMPSLTERMMLIDTLSYLPDDILVKVDRAAMACSLETRVPLLDHRVFEFAWRLPLRYKVRDGVGKWLLRQVLYRHVPRALIERPKMGFGVPIDAWLRGPLKSWASTLLDPVRMRNDGYFKPEPIARKWEEHQSGARNWQYHLWDVLMFQAWLDRERG